MIGVAAALIAFGFLEIGQDIIIAPPVAAHSGPVIIIPFVAANIYHRVDRAAPAKAAPARWIADASVQTLLGDGIKSPVCILGDERHHPRCFYAEIIIRAPSFDQADRPLSIFAESPGNRASCRSAADN